MLPKHIRAGERRARELGVIEDLAAFDEAAAAFPKPPAIVAAALVERPELIYRDLEDWEGNFLEAMWERSQATARQYPPELIELFTASQTVMEGGGDSSSSSGSGKGKKGKGGDAAPAADAAAAGGAEGGEAGAAAGGDAAAAAAAAAPTVSVSDDALAGFYEDSGDSAARSNTTDEAQAGLAMASRLSSADKINDTRSLDRAYSQRLILLARNKASGEWGLPGVVVRDDEHMCEAAERAVRSAFHHDADLDLWFPGASPMGHWLQPFSPEVQQATGRYGAKIFFYRAQIMAGKLRIPAPAELAALAAASKKQSDGIDGVYDDLQWLTRDETEAVLPRPFYKYAHQVFGGGAGEEYARRTAWLAKIEAKGLTPAQASGRRNFRTSHMKDNSLRLLAVATRRQAELAARPFDPEGTKVAAVKDEFAATSKRLREQKLIGAATRVALQTPTMAAKAAMARAAKKAAEAAAAPGAAAAAAAAAAASASGAASAAATA